MTGVQTCALPICRIERTRVQRQRAPRSQVQRTVHRQRLDTTHGLRGDPAGTTKFEKNLPATPAAFLDAIKPFPVLVVGCECMFAWYWLADLC